MQENGTNRSELPEGWKLLKLADIFDKVSLNKIKIKQRDYKQKGNYPVIDQGQELIGGYYDEEKLLVPGEPPFIVFGDHTKVKKYIPFKFIPGADGVKVLKPKSHFDPKYLFYLLHTIRIEDKGYGRHFQFLEKENFFVAPLSQQHQIVSRLEELFSELDKSIEQLKTAQQQLKVYRQSVLQWAFEGKLGLNHDSPDLPDAHDFVQNTGKNRANQKNQENQGLDNLPEGWKWVTIQHLIVEKKGMTTGPFGTALKKSEHQVNGVPVLGIENIGEGVFQMPNKVFITKEKSEVLNAFTVQKEDVIISRSGTVGEICEVPKSMEGAIISTNLIRVRLSLQRIMPKFFVYMFQGGGVRQQVFRLCKGSSRAFLNQTILSSLNFPYCPLNQQQQIIQEIETRLSVADKLEETISQSLQQAAALRQSILKQAFEGRLVYG